jgi:hypothetical protein
MEWCDWFQIATGVYAATENLCYGYQADRISFPRYRDGGVGVGPHVANGVTKAFNLI